MKKRSLLFILTVVLIGSIAFPVTATAEAIIDIKRWTFCKGVQDREAKDAVSDTVYHGDVKELFFWMEIVGGREALATLEASGQLRIRHEWRRGIFVTDNIDVGITPDRWLEYREAIRKQVEEGGLFTYRTYSFKKNLRIGRYKIIVSDGHGNHVTELGGRGQFRPTIEISR